MRAAGRGFPPVSEQERERKLLYMQQEALGLNRRDHLSIKDFRERKAQFVPLAQITRRVDEAGSEENRLAAQPEVRRQLTAWATAYEGLEDDGTADQDLRDVNEGKPMDMSGVYLPLKVLCYTLQTISPFVKPGTCPLL